MDEDNNIITPVWSKKGGKSRNLTQAEIVKGVGLTQDERRLRDRFVIEYLKDFSGHAACVRIGQKNPATFWSKMQKCGYVQNKISKRLEDWEFSAIINKNQLCAMLWREANDFVYGTCNSRVAAASKLSKILGFEENIIKLKTDNLVGIDSPTTKEEFIEAKQIFDDEF